MLDLNKTIIKALLNGDNIQGDQLKKKLKK